MHTPSPHPDVTLIVPTHERAPYLRRLLAYLAGMGARFPIRIVDSSAAECRSANADTVAAVSDRLDVTHQLYDCGFQEKLIRTLESLQTDLCVFCGDDDFLIPAAVEKCADFLARHPEYATAAGIVCLANCADLDRTDVTALPFRCVEHDDPLERLRDHATHFHFNFYSVHRTSQVLESIRRAARETTFPEAGNCGEYLVSFLGVLHGKLKSMPDPFMLRQVHAAADSVDLVAQIDVDRAGDSLSRYYQCLTRAVASRTALSETAARRLIDGMDGIHDCAKLFDKAAALRRDRRRRRLPPPLGRMLREAGRVGRQVASITRRRKRAPNLAERPPVPWNDAAFRQAFEQLVRHPDGIDRSSGDRAASPSRSSGS